MKRCVRCLRITSGHTEKSRKISPMHKTAVCAPTVALADAMDQAEAESAGKASIIADPNEYPRGGIPAPRVFSSSPHILVASDYMRQNVKSTRQIILMISENCNLRCKYCYESFKSDHQMSVDTAIRLLRHEFDRLGKTPEIKFLSIIFLGGEPLLNFGLIREVTKWICENPPIVPFELSTRTNGTLLSDEMKSWFFDNKEKIQLGLSLDGLGEMQKKGRTHLPVDIDFFARNWPKNRVNIVLFNDTVQYLSDAVLSFRDKGILFSTDIACGIRWTPEAAASMEEQLIDLIPLYVSDPDEAMESGLFKYSVKNFLSEEKFTELPFCGDMTNIAAYDTDGTKYCCHMFTPLVIGKEKSTRFKNFTMRGKSIPIDGRCLKCPWVNECKICYAMNLKICGDICTSASPTTTCEAVKAVARACCRYFLENIKYCIESDLYVPPDRIELAEKVFELLNRDAS